MADTLEMMERIRKRQEMMQMMAAPDEPSVGEAVGKAFQDLYEGAIEKPARNVLAGYKAGAAGMYDLGANAMMLINRAGDYLTEKTGVGRMSKESAFGAAEQWLRDAARQVAPDAETLDDDVVSKIYQGLGGAPVAIAEYATGARALGPIAGFAAVDALRAAQEGPEAAAVAGAKGALMGGAFKAAQPLKRLPRSGALASLGGTAALAEGGGAEDVTAGAATLGILGALGAPGKVGIRDIYRKPTGARRYPQERARQDVLELVERVREQAPAPTAPRPAPPTPPARPQAPVPPVRLPTIPSAPEPAKIKIKPIDVTAAYKGQINGDVYATVGDKAVGRMQVQYYRPDNSITIADMVVDPAYRRQGIARRMLEQAKSEFPGARIDFGVTTKEGEAFARSYRAQQEAPVRPFQLPPIEPRPQPTPAPAPAPAQAPVRPFRMPSVEPAPPYVEPIAPKPMAPKVKPAQKVVGQLRKAADGLQGQIDKKRSPAIAEQNYTPRRARIAASMGAEADRLEAMQGRLRMLADLHERGEVPKVLAGITTRAQLESLRWRDAPRPNDPYDSGGAARLKRAGITPQNYQQAKEALQALTAKPSAEQAAQRARGRIKQRIQEIEYGRGIKDFFQTPEELAKEMVSRADIRPGMHALEPSAGGGAIARQMKAGGLQGKLTVNEPAPALAEILREQGFKPTTQDFLKMGGQYDRIIMNPPFSKGQDMAHVRHAYDRLKPGGRIVSIMGPHGFFANDKASRSFRDWFAKRGGTVEDLPARTFEQTQVGSRLVVIDKPGAMVPKARARAVRPERDILEFLANRGGVVDQTGELKAMDAQRWHREKPFRPKLVTKKGLTPDYAREAAEEAGYLRKGSTISDLYQAMDDALRGRGGMTLEQQMAKQERAAAMPVDRGEIEYRARNFGIPEERIKQMSTDKLAAAVRREQAILDEMPFDVTPIGKQRVVPGAERISDRQLIERRMAGRKGTDKPQKAADEALFDVMGRGQKDLFTFPGPIAGIERAWRPVANRIIDSLAEGKYSPFARWMGGYPFKDPTMGQLPQRTEYLGRRGEAQGQIFRFNRMANTLNDTLRRAGPVEQRAIFDYLTTKGADPATVPQPYRGAAVASKSTIKKIGRELVRRGLLSEKAYRENADAYLPRVYLKFLMDRTDFTTGLRLSEQGYLKARIKDLPKEYRDLYLGEVRDPGFLVTKAVSVPSRDLAMQDFLRDLTYNQNWVLPQSTLNWTAPGLSQPRKVTPFWLKREADMLRDRARRMTDPQAQQRATQIADQMAAQADQALGALKGAVPKEYRQMPDSPRYGDLRGLVVRKEIYNDIVGEGRMWVGEKGFYEKTWDKLGTANAIWKMMKVPLNPPTQVRNFVSNGVLLHLSGVPMARLPGLYARALREISRNGKYYREAVKHGIPASTFSAEELVQIMPDIMRVKGQKGGVSGALYKMAEPLARLTKAPGDLYQFSETWGKTVKIIDAMERQGMSGRQAAAAAQEALFDYSLVPPLVKALRSRPIGAPFITFYYKAFPAITKAAIRNPGKLAMYYLVPKIMGDALLANLRDVTPEDVDKLREALPEWMRQQGHTYVFPYKDESGRWTFTNFGYFLPWAMHERTLRNAYEIATGDYGGTVNDLFSELGILGGPVPQVMAAIQTGIDPFTQRKIIEDTDPPEIQAYKIMNYAWSLAGPSWLSDRGVVGHVQRSMENEPNYYGDAPLSMPQALARGAGLNIYPVDPEASRARNLRRMGFKIDEMRRAGRRAMRHPALSDEEREDLQRQYREQMEQAIMRLREYERRSIVHPNLR